MKKILIIVIVMALVIGGGIFAYKRIANNKPKSISTDNTISNKEKTEEIDYLVLVNKQNKLPDGWEEKVQLVTVKDAWGDEIKVEKQAYEKYKELKTSLEKEQVINIGII